MEFKRFLVGKLILFSMLSTLIAVAVSVIGSVFDGGARLGYDALLQPIEYAGLCLLPTLVTWSRRELTPRQLLFRKALLLVLLEAVILFLAFRSPVINTADPAVVLAIAGSVCVIFALVTLFNWLRGSVEAKRLTRDLAAFQKLHE